VAQALLVRDLARAPQWTGAEARRASLDDAEALRQALAGLAVVLMVSAPESPDRVQQHRRFVDAAVAAGVRQLVYTSFCGAAPAATFTLARDHWATEQYIRQSGLAFTFLRDNLYADFFPDLVGSDGIIRGPAGEGKVAAVARDDVADAAAAVLLAAGDHASATYDLTGPEALSLGQVAAVLTAGLGRPVSYRPETLDEAYASRASYGAPAWQLDAWVSTYTAIAAGELQTVSSNVARLTGHAPTSLAELLARAGAPHT
jgi:NAD(P)H dehydrogenase (quinone)